MAHGHVGTGTASAAVAAALAAAMCALGPPMAQAQTTTPPVSASQGQASTTGSVRLEMIPSLIVMSARGAHIQGQTLILSGVAPDVITFADRPVRAAGHLLTKDFLTEWTTPDGSFGKDPPNATVSVLSKDGDSASDVVVELRRPHFDGDQLAFDVRILEGNLTGADGPASVFIDVIGLPFTPLSYAGVARRTARRAFWYGAAVAPHYYGPPAYNLAPAYPPPYPYPYRYGVP